MPILEDEYMLMSMLYIPMGTLSIILYQWDHILSQVSMIISSEMIYMHQSLQQAIET